MIRGREPGFEAPVSFEIDNLIESWKASGCSKLQDGASDEDLRLAQARLGLQLPSSFLDLYSRCNGAYVVGGNIQLYALDGSDFSVVHASKRLRDWQWPIPEDLVVFGNNGGDELFGVWVPKNGIGSGWVIEIGSIFEEGSFAIVGTTLPNFLRGRSAYYLFSRECPTRALDLIGAPHWLRSRQSFDLSDDDGERLLRWASPGLPNRPLSAYDARLTAAEIRKLVSEVA